jgi:hypothetical protein
MDPIDHPATRPFSEYYRRGIPAKGVSGAHANWEHHEIKRGSTEMQADYASQAYTNKSQSGILPFARRGDWADGVDY